MSIQKQTASHTGNTISSQDFLNSLTPEFSKTRPIYHYCSYDGMKSIIGHNPEGKHSKHYFSIRLTDSRYVNDLTDSTFLVDTISPELQDLFDVQYENVITNLKNRYTYVACFTTNGDSLPMWRMYSDYGGYAIGLKDAEMCSLLKTVHINESRNDKKLNLKLFPVVYRKSNEIDDLIKDVVRFCEENYSGEDILSELNFCLTILAIIVKDKAFAYEKECRLVALPTDGQTVDNMIQINDQNRPYVLVETDNDQINTNPDFKDVIKEIVVGPRPGGSQENDKRSLELLLKKNNRLGTSVHDPIIVRTSDIPLRRW